MPQSTTARPLAIEDGDLRLFDGVLPPDQSAALFQRLMTEIDWQRESLFLFGRTVQTPRLTAWYGDAPYTYSGLTHPPRDWPDLLQDMRRWVERLTGSPFNTVLLNLYRDGSDSMSWHSDDEPELGRNPTIASLNFGATRRFRFRNIQDRSKTLAVDLKDASLLVMGGALQHHWQHALPKSKKPMGARVNLTFRQVSSASPDR